MSTPGPRSNRSTCGDGGFATAIACCSAWRSLRQPTIAAINGYAFGGGLELALAADIRIAADSATFALPETKIGTLPGWAGTKRLPEAIGVARAKQMIFSGGRIDADDRGALGFGQRGRRARRAHGPVPRAGVGDRGERSNFGAACQGGDQWGRGDARRHWRGLSPLARKTAERGLPRSVRSARRASPVDDVPTCWRERRGDHR